jgi:YVTN family beta-propeller protein
MQTRTLSALLGALALVATAGCSSSPGGGGDAGGNPPDSGSTPDAGGNPDAGNTAILPGPSNGSAMALSPDDSTAVVVNRDVGSVTVLAVSASASPPTASSRAEVSVGAGSEPWQAVISPDGKTAYVVLRHDQKLVQIQNLTTSPAVGASLAVGSEPTAVALTPTGAQAWVTNWVDGTVTVVDTASMTAVATVDLNAPLAATGYLGTVNARPALAHPRSIAISNNGSGVDTAEAAYVTEYFGQATAPEASDGSNADTRKVGLVYRIAVADRSVTVISLAALTDMGFKDERAGTAGCYPNQLQAIAINSHFAYVVSVCASPKGPTGPKVTTTACSTVTDCASLSLVDPVCVLPADDAAGKVCVDVASVKTTTAPLISTIDLSQSPPVEVSGSPASLNQRFLGLYAANAVTDDATRRYPLFASDIAFVAGSSVGYVSANGADAVFRIHFDSTAGTIPATGGVGASTNNFIDLVLTGIPAGQLGRGPIGIAIGHTATKTALVANDITRNVSLLDFNAQTVAGAPATPSVVQTTALPSAGTPAEAQLTGKRLFNTGLGRWSLKGQAWGSCQVCHSDGLTDNVTWYFARGPRQSTSLDGSFSKKNSADQRILNWTAINDEVADFEGNVRGISGGVGAIISALSTPPSTGDRIDTSPTDGGIVNQGLSGSSAQAADPTNPLALPFASVVPDWSNITTFMQQIRSPRAPTTLDTVKMTAGAALFNTACSCTGCHSGDKWTVSQVFYTPSPAEGVALKTKPWPALNGLPTAIQPSTSAAGKVMRFGSTNPAAFDQLVCALRPVGTFNVAESGAGIAELRIDMATAAQGAGDVNGDGKGYNVPSLLGVATGAPYMHAGNARTLEALLSSTFQSHHQSLSPNCLTDTDPTVLAGKIDDLVAYMLSIDGDAATTQIPALGTGGGQICQ